jgi:hypothetical protein
VLVVASSGLVAADAVPKATTLAVSTTGHVAPASHLPVGLLLRPYDDNAATISKAVNLAKSAGVTAIAAVAPWYEVAGQTAEQPENWAPFDKLVADAAHDHMRISVQVFGTPAWVHPDVGASVDQNTWYPPRGAAELADWSVFVGDLVKRYGTAVSSYELWNEPNAPQFWLPSPSPSEYASLMRAGYTAAKQADPAVTVEFGGLSSSDVGYLQAYYRAASALPDAAADHYFFNRMDVHPYTANRLPEVRESYDRYEGPYGAVDTDFDGVAMVERAMNQAGDPGKTIRIGEYGASTATTWMPAVANSYRALMLKLAVRMASKDPYVSELDWYGFLPTRDDSPAWAIVSRSLAPSATFTALKQVLTRPRVRVAVRAGARPLGTRSVSGRVRVRIILPRGAKVAHCALYADGHLVAESRGGALVWNTAAVTPGVHHVLGVAYGRGGSVWPGGSIPVTVTNPPVAGVRGAVTSIGPALPSAGVHLTVAASVSSTVPGVLPTAVIALRNAAGRAFDLPESHDVYAPLAGATVRFTGTAPPAGVYTMWLAWSDGSTWRQLGATHVVTVA